MIDKVQKIRDEVVMMHNLLPVMDGDNISLNYADRICTTLEMYIDSLQEEPVSEELEEAAKRYSDNEDPICTCEECLLKSFKVGAKWQKEYMVAKTIDAHCFGFQGDVLFSFRLPADNYLVGSEVKVIVIKED